MAHSSHSGARWFELLNRESVMDMKRANVWGPLLLGLLVVLALTGFTWNRSGVSPAAVDTDTRSIELVVSLSERKLRVRSGDEVLATYSVAVGKEGHQTPTGAYRVRRIIWNPSWTPPNAPWARDKKPTPPGAKDNPMGRVKIFFAEPDYFIHGTTDEGSVGRAASHGCIRMRNADVIALAKLLMEHGGATRSETWFRRVINRVTDTQEVRLSSPVPMRVRRS
jgi:murein L,D-transpeptidase YcbB/YkuD